MTLKQDVYGSDFIVLLITLLAALSCNVFITGLNQISDLEIDRINKPHLPLVTGELSTGEAKKWILLSLVLSLLSSFFVSHFFGYLIALIGFLGWAYSSPPIRFKRYHFWAASAISLVRGPLVNIGIAVHFVFSLDRNLLSNPNSLSSILTVLRDYKFGVWMLPLTVFVAAFSLGIAWFKDLPDTEGDESHDVGTLAVKHGRKTAFLWGFTLVSLAYVFLIFWGIFFHWGIFFTAYHMVALGIFIQWSKTLDLNSTNSLKRFYKTYWILFFLEYFSFFLIYFR